MSHHIDTLNRRESDRADDDTTDTETDDNPFLTTNDPKTPERKPIASSSTWGLSVRNTWFNPQIPSPQGSCPIISCASHVIDLKQFFPSIVFMTIKHFP